MFHNKMITENIVINKNFSWVDVEHPIAADFDFLKTEFKLSPLLVHDCLKPEHLPKYEKSIDGHYFLIRIYDPSCKDKDTRVQQLTNKIAIFITNERLLTIHNDEVVHLRRYLNHHPVQDSKIGTLHQLFRLTLFSYEDPILMLQGQYEGFETQILSKQFNTLKNEDVYLFRRKIFIIKGVLQMTQAALNNSRNFWMDSPDLLQDIKEGIDQLYFRLDGLSQNFDQLFALHLSINDQRNNEVMKILTVFASVMLPLTFVASFYGMNFDHIPGLHSVRGFVGVIIIMATITFMTLWVFIRKKWLKISM